MITIGDIYQYLDKIAPFASQEKWDNSGLLVGDMSRCVSGVMVTLDITIEAVEAAASQGCDLVISHHPVIFSPLKRLSPDQPVYQLAANRMAAICSHTPMDIAAGGINDILVTKLSKEIALEDTVLPLDESGVGRIVTLGQPMENAQLAGIVKNMLGCSVVRYSDAGTEIRTLGICSGSGASMLEEIAGKCDALLTGDVKHDRWYTAKDLGMSLIDCGHYHTEVVMVSALAEKLREQFPTLKVMEWEGGDPVAYV